MSISKETLRKFLHMSTFLVFVFSIEFMPPLLTAAIGALVSIVYLSSELVRRTGESVPILSRAVRVLGRPFEIRGIAMSPLLMAVAMVLIFAFFDKTTAYVAAIALCLGDGIASLIGKRYGKHVIYQSKTLEGSLSFFAVTFVGFLFFLDFSTALASSAVCTMVELVSGKYDNLTVPLSAAVWLLL